MGIRKGPSNLPTNVDFLQMSEKRVEEEEVGDGERHVEMGTALGQMEREGHLMRNDDNAKIQSDWANLGVFYAPKEGFGRVRRSRRVDGKGPLGPRGDG